MDFWPFETGVKSGIAGLPISKTGISNRRNEVKLEIGGY